MPFKSEAQRRLFFAKHRRGEISKKTLDEWQDETRGKKLPERVEKKAAESATAAAPAAAPAAATAVNPLQQQYGANWQQQLMSQKTLNQQHARQLAMTRGVKTASFDAGVRDAMVKIAATQHFAKLASDAAADGEELVWLEDNAAYLVDVDGSLLPIDLEKNASLGALISSGARGAQRLGQATVQGVQRTGQSIAGGAQRVGSKLPVITRWSVGKSPSVSDQIARSARLKKMRASHLMGTDRIPLPNPVGYKGPARGRA